MKEQMVANTVFTLKESQIVTAGKYAINLKSMCWKTVFVNTINLFMNSITTKRKHAPRNTRGAKTRGSLES